MTAPHDAPSAAQLVEAVREFIEGDVMASTSGRLQFHARVAVNVLRMVERELALGPGQEAAHAGGLAGLGFASDVALSAAIRDGSLDGDRLAEAAAFLTRTVRDKLAVANPRYLEGPNAGPPG